MLRGTRRALLAGRATYMDKVKGYSPTAYWPMNELAGTVCKDRSGNGFDGTYTGVTLGQPGIGDGHKCPLFDGVNDYVNIYSAGLNAAFDGAEGTFMIWGLVNDWTDDTVRLMMRLYDDADNSYDLKKNNGPAGANAIRAYAEAGAAGDGDNDSTLTGSTVFNQYVLTWSDLANQAEWFQNGVSAGTIALANSWDGAGLDNTRTLIGANITTPGGVWDGRLAHCALWAGTVLSVAQIGDLYLI